MCVCVFYMLQTCMRTCEITLQMSRGHLLFFLQPNFKHKGKRRRQSRTHTLSHTHTHRLRLLHSSLTVREVISQTNTSYLALALTHIQCHHNGRRSLSHKHTGLCFQTKARSCSFVMLPHKTSSAERKVLTGICLVIG